MRAVIDTNILIDYLAGGEVARDELARHADASISAITWIVHRATRQPAPCAVLVRRSRLNAIRVPAKLPS